MDFKLEKLLAITAGFVGVVLKAIQFVFARFFTGGIFRGMYNNFMRNMPNELEDAPMTEYNEIFTDEMNRMMNFQMFVGGFFTIIFLIACIIFAVMINQKSYKTSGIGLIVVGALGLFLVGFIPGAMALVSGILLVTKKEKNYQNHY